ncbi:MAG: hypothetical protein LBM13_01465 [Candidatus Ancillula sp.]|nr:hypothetical protein [Candidatus Ancillula sp.]
MYFYDEEEVSGDNYIGSKLYGLVHQRYQPKQYITFSGKYYFIDAITPKEGVALKRASDRIESRLQYRNIKTMKIVEYSVDNSETGVINYSNYSLRLLEVDFGIKNNGYYEMEDLNNLEQSRKTEFENPNIRNYSLKTVEQIKFNKKIEDAERESICLLLNEIFRTIFPYDYFYIFATTLRNKKSDSLSNLVPDLEVGKSCKPEDLSNSIFIVEDSDMDLGLLEAVVGNLERLMGIVYSYLKWYQEAQEAPKSVADLKNQKIKLPDNWQPNLENQMIEKMGEISKIRSQIDRKLHGKDRKYGKDGVNDSPQNSLVNTPRTKKLSIFKRVKLYFQRLGKVDGKTYEQWNWEMIEIGNRLTEKLSQTKGVKTTNKVKDILNKNNKPNQKVEDNSLKEEGQSE